MFNQEKIEQNEHKRWFKESTQNPDKELLIFEVNSKPMGFVNFNLINKKECDWGFYIAPNSQKGIGSIMGKLALDYAFNELEVVKIKAQALSSNKLSIKYHEKMGFVKSKTLRKSFYNQSSYENIICFELSINYWNE